jgi:hypothetical protein
LVWHAFLGAREGTSLTRFFLVDLCMYAFSSSGSEESLKSWLQNQGARGAPCCIILSSFALFGYLSLIPICQRKDMTHACQYLLILCNSSLQEQ